MPPCLLAIRSLLPSASRTRRSILPSFPPFPPTFHSSHSTWRSPAQNRHGIARDGDGEPHQQDEEEISSIPPDPSGDSPIYTAQRPLGHETEVHREPYVSASGSRIISLMAPASPGNTTYATQWDTAFAKLRLLGYSERQDEENRTKWRDRIMFDRETVCLAKKVQAHFMEMERLSQKVHSEIEDGPFPTEMDGAVPSPPSPAHLLGAGDDRTWYAVMLWLLAYDPQHALDFVHATHHAPYPPLFAVQDSLLHLAYIFHNNPDARVKQQRLNRLGHVVTLLAHRTDGQYLRLPHGTLAWLMPAMRPEQLLRLWEAVREHRVDIHWNTLLHFATRLAHADYLDQALHALSEAQAQGAPSTATFFLSTCSTLLRSAMRQPSGMRVGLRMVDSLVEMGVALDLPLCNILMLNAVEAHDLTTAWSIYRSLPGYGLEANDRTFAVLLKACKINLDDTDMLNETIRNAIAHSDVKSHPILAADILNTLALHHTRHHPEMAFQTLADAYSQLFDTTPLSDLGILPPPSQSARSEDRMQPTRGAIGVMLITHLHHLFLQTQSHTQPHALYRRYRALVASRVAPWADTIDEDYIPNAFLVALTKTKAGLLPAAAIIKDMQRHAPDHVGPRQCEPTVQTWTILMHGFQKHGQMKMAEQVLQYMRSKGVEPDQVTWNVLVEGYAISRDSEGVDSILQRLREEGVGWDQFTTSSVRKFKSHSHGKAESMLNPSWRAGDQQRELDFTQDLREGIGRRFVEGEKSSRVGEAGSRESGNTEVKEGTYALIV
ncbi:uncharacterized protein RCC_06091 [Ramularia collo-cygni]|uniref:Pentatricopeptide repeat protein n=1 Tax=Ramularia collo-cygni TaxID=112498 RepID=A0A2D3VBY4_9PEZI|nr:uncharacterized protein RCC_06091 [Ramularia collo-cygni]CZT20234.1 uncharacterized protein RCC_06091 [Ramularia collo-cygni]